MSDVKKIIVIGSGFSGSGAIFDYLAGRPDVEDPLNGHEFRIVQDPDGLVSLHNSIGPNFSVNGANAAIKNFASFCERIDSSKIPYAKQLGIREEFINKKEMKKYIEKIVLLKYNGMSSYEKVKLPFLLFLFSKIKKIKALNKGDKAKLGTIYFPVNEKEFLALTEEFIDNILVGKDLKNSDIVINQGGSFWRPFSSTQYYGKRKVVVVTRDPRDIFFELQSKGYSYPGEDVSIFCKWYSNIMDRIDKKEWMRDDVVVHIRFEDFVRNFEYEKKKLDASIGLNLKVTSSYNPRNSIKNVGLFSSLPPEINNIIEKNLAEWIQV